MSEVDINKEAFKQAEKELLERKVKEVKGYILETLEKTELKKKEKAKLDEELRILKLDLEDLRQGKFDKIEERKQKSKVAREVSVDIDQAFNHVVGSLIDHSTISSGFSSGGDTFTFSNGTFLGDIGALTATNTPANWQDFTAGTYALRNGKVIYL